MKWIVEELPQLKGYQIEWAEPGNFYFSRRNSIFHSTSLNPPFDFVAAVKAPFWKQTAANFRPAQRLLRFLVTNVIPLTNNEVFVTFDKSVGIVRKGKYQALAGLSRPTRVLRSACAVDKNENIFFGEYLANNDRGEMSVYRYTSGSDRVEIVYKFPHNSIKHIHGLYFDPFTDSIFCLTGDEETECKILQTFDEFKTIEVIGEGDESWRAVSLLFSEESLFYGMDAEFRANHIYEMNRKSLYRRSLGNVNGTVFYSKQSSGEFFFTTTAENAPNQKENVAAIWKIDSEGNCSEIARFKKDFWNATLFMFGTIHFPFANKIENELYFHLVGVKQDNRTFKIVQKL